FHWSPLHTIGAGLAVAAAARARAEENQQAPNASAPRRIPCLFASISLTARARKMPLGNPARRNDCVPNQRTDALERGRGRHASSYACCSLTRSSLVIWYMASVTALA